MGSKWDHETEIKSFSDSRLTVYYTRYRYYYRLVRLKSSLLTNLLISEWCFNAAL